METFEILKQAGCDMEVVCDKQWGELLPTDEDGIKFCGECKKLVFYTTTPAELRLAAKRGLCVFIVPNSLAHIERFPRLISTSKVSRQRIRRTEEKALRRLRGPTLGVSVIR